MVTSYSSLIVTQWVHSTRQMAGHAADPSVILSGEPETTTDHIDSTRKPTGGNRYAINCAILASMNSIILGYDIGVMSGAVIYIKEDLKISDVQVEILAGVLNLYCLVGCFLAGRTSDLIGRRYTIVIAQVILFAGAILMGFATNYAFLMVGRFVTGVGVGFAIMIAPVYTAELSPTAIRGLITSFTEVFVNSGILLGYVSNYAFSKLPTHLGWRFMFGIATVPSVVIAVVILFMPESPRWLVMHGRLKDAKHVLDKTCNTPQESRDRISGIMEAAGIPIDCHDDVVPVSKERRHGEGVWRDLLLRPTRPVRHILTAAVGLYFFHQATGISTVVLYSPRIFEKAGIKSGNQKLLATIAVGFTKTVTVLVATLLLDRIGRRPLLLTSVAGMVASLGIIAGTNTLIQHSSDHHKLTWAVAVCVLAVLVYVAFFSIGLGPIAVVYSSETFPLRLRAQGMSMVIALNRVVSAVVSMTFLSLYHAITIGGTFFLYACVGAVAWVFFYTLLPETQNRALEDMEGLFGNFSSKPPRVDMKDDDDRKAQLL